jgi:hypothetical protein
VQVTQDIFKRAFEVKHPNFLDAAVRDATVLLETRLREMCDAPADMVGIQLVDYAFNKEHGLLTPTSLPVAEREGLAQLFRGAVLSIRNPVGHRSARTAPPEAFSAIGVVDYLLRSLANAARERYVKPFLSGALATSVLGVRRIDMDGDGADELVVVIAEMTTAGTHQGRIIVLNRDATKALSGRSVALPFPHLVSVVTTRDFDDDGRPEPLVILAEPGGTHAAVLLDYTDQGTIAPVELELGEPLLSYGRPHEVIQEMEWMGAVTIVCHERDGSVTHWTYDEGTFIEAITDF